MPFRLLLRHRSFKMVLLSLVGLLIATQYQNCAPMGDATGVGSNSSAAGVGGNTVNCAAVGAPSIGAGPAAQSVSSGLGTGSGDVYPQNINIGYTRSYAGQALSDNCNATGVNGFDINCTVRDNGFIEVDLTHGDGDECLSGTATVTVRVTDTICNRDSNAVSIQVNVRNVCPTEQVVKKDNSTADLAPARADQFGYQVAISGTTAAVVALSDDQGVTNAGAVFVYRLNGSSWVFQQKLRPSQQVANDEINSVAIDGNTIAMGSAYHGNNGIVYIFRFNGTTWAESQSIEPSLKNASVKTQAFGADISLSGGYLAVGSPGYNHGDPTNFAKAGGVFVYQDNGTSFSESRVLAASDKTLRDYFGAFVKVDSGRVLVGAPLSPDADKNAAKGKAYVYQIASGAETKIDGGASVDNGSQFGFAGDLLGNRLVVSAITGKDSNGDRTGSVITFDGSSGAWVKQGTAVIAGENPADNFGYSVSLTASNLYVGAPLHSIGALTQNGAAYAFSLGGANVWTSLYKYFPRSPNRASNDFFGESIAVGAGYILGGSRAADLTDLNLGSVDFIKLP